MNIKIINKSLFNDSDWKEIEYLNSNVELGSNNYKNGIFKEKDKTFYVFPVLASTLNVKDFFGNTFSDFRVNIDKLILGEKDVLINFPKCLRINNNNNIFIGNKSKFSKQKSCDICFYNSVCYGIEKNILKAYDNEIELKPILKNDKRLIFELLSKYKKYFKDGDYNETNTPIKINHYQFVLDFILNNVKKDDSILEIGCFLGLFLDFLNKIGFKNILGVDKDIEAIKLGNKYSLPLIEGDIFLDNFNFGKNFNFIFMIGVLHNDYDLGAYSNLTVSDFCYNILGKIINFLDKDGFFIFTTNKFILDQKKIEKIGYKFINFYKDSGGDNIFYYILKK